MQQQWQMTLGIETQSAFHTLGPGRTLPLVDRALQVDAEGCPYIPGSTVRGRVRAHLERLLKALDLPVCCPPRPDQTCPHHPALIAQLAALDEPYCLACRIFGSAWRDSATVFGDFRLAQDGLRPEASVGERTSVGISRRLGSAQAERLFLSETTIPGGRLRFIGRVEGRLTHEEIGWLLAAMNLVTHLGGDKARGLGRVRLQVADLSRWDVDAQAWATADSQALIKEVMDHAAL